MLARSGLRLVIAGLVLGILAAWAGTRALEGILAGTSPTDPIVFTVVATALGLVGLTASWLPSRKPRNGDPTMPWNDSAASLQVPASS